VTIFISIEVITDKKESPNKSPAARLAKPGETFVYEMLSRFACRVMLEVEPARENRKEMCGW